MPIHQAGDVLTDCCCHWCSDCGSVPHTTLLQKIFYYPFKYLSPRFPGSSLCKELRGILGVCSRKCENDDAIFQKPPMNVYNLFISKSVLLNLSDHSSWCPSPLSINLSSCFIFLQVSISFYKNPVIYFAYLNSSFVFSCVFTLAIMSICRRRCCSRCRYSRKSFYQKRQFFCNEKCLSYNCKRTQTKKLS